MAASGANTCKGKQALIDLWIGIALPNEADAEARLCRKKACPTSHAKRIGKQIGGKSRDRLDDCAAKQRQAHHENVVIERRDGIAFADNAIHSRHGLQQRGNLATAANHHLGRAFFLQERHIADELESIAKALFGENQNGLARQILPCQTGSRTRVRSMPRISTRKRRS